MPIELDGVLDMPYLIEQDIFIGFNDADVRVIEMFCYPGGVNQHLRVRVLISCHVSKYLRLH
jgi:hypothetical protein